MHGRKNYRKHTSSDQERSRNHAIARRRAPADHANANIKTWRIHHNYRGSHHRPTPNLQAILTCENPGITAAHPPARGGATPLPAPTPRC